MTKLQSPDSGCPGNARLDSGDGHPDTAIILAAGVGSRMRPITDSIPKALVKVHGKALLDHGLDTLASAKVTKVVVNVHHHAEQMELHLAGRHSPEIIISDEREQLLDSGGGVANAISQLGTAPFYLLNGDSFWIEGIKPNLVQLSETWRSRDMDILLLVSGTATAVGYENKGDFTMDSDGRLHRRMESTTAPFAYVGAAIMNPAIFDDVPDGPFSLNLLFDRAIENGRLFGQLMDGLWLHVGTPDAIRLAEEAIAKSAA